MGLEKVREFEKYLQTEKMFADVKIVHGFAKCNGFEKYPEF